MLRFCNAFKRRHAGTWAAVLAPKGNGGCCTFASQLLRPEARPACWEAHMRDERRHVAAGAPCSKFGGKDKAGCRVPAHRAGTLLPAVLSAAVVRAR